MNHCLSTLASARSIAQLISIWCLSAGLLASETDSVDAHGLIEKNCSSCHGSEIYTREDRKVTSLSALQTQVRACNSNLKTGMSPEQLEAIAALLNEEYYKFRE